MKPHSNEKRTRVRTIVALLLNDFHLLLCPARSLTILQVCVCCIGIPTVAKSVRAAVWHCGVGYAMEIRVVPGMCDVIGARNQTWMEYFAWPPTAGILFGEKTEFALRPKTEQC